MPFSNLCHTVRIAYCAYSLGVPLVLSLLHWCHTIWCIVQYTIQWTVCASERVHCLWSHLRGSCHNPLTFQCLVFPLQILVVKSKLLLFSCDPLAGCLQCLGKRRSHNVYYAHLTQKSIHYRQRHFMSAAAIGVCNSLHLGFDMDVHI